MSPRGARPVVALALLLAACAGGARARAEPQFRGGTTPSGLYYEAIGSGRRTVVLVHAFSLDRRQWDAETAALRGRARVVRYDQRGHGRSAPIAASFSSADDLREVLDAAAAGACRVDVVGLSSGARIALDFALAHPARAGRLVLASPAVGGFRPADDFTWLSPVLEAARAGDAAEAARRWAATPLMRVADPATAAGVRRMALDNAAIWGMSPAAERPLSPPAIARLGELSSPVLVVTGARDFAATRRSADTLAALVRGARRLDVGGAGHLVTLDAPVRVVAEMLDFLRLDAAPAGDGC